MWFWSSCKFTQGWSERSPRPDTHLCCRMMFIHRPVTRLGLFFCQLICFRANKHLFINNICFWDQSVIVTVLLLDHRDRFQQMRRVSVELHNSYMSKTCAVSVSAGRINHSTVIRPDARWASARVCPLRQSRVLESLMIMMICASGAHMLPSYYGIRGRSFISDSDFCPSTKQFSPDVYSSTLGGKPLGCEPSTMSSYSSLIDSYYPETFGDYRSAATFSSSGGSFLPSSALSSLLPPFGGESSHLFLVWITLTFRITVVDLKTATQKFSEPFYLL